MQLDGFWIIGIRLFISFQGKVAETSICIGDGIRLIIEGDWSPKPLTSLFELILVIEYCPDIVDCFYKWRVDCQGFLIVYESLFDVVHVSVAQCDLAVNILPEVNKFYCFLEICQGLFIFLLVYQFQPLIAKHISLFISLFPWHEIYICFEVF